MTAAASDLTQTTAHTVRRDWRGSIFRIVAVIVAAFTVFGDDGFVDLVAPWIEVGERCSCYTPELHRWHAADISALVTILLVGSLLALLVRPRAQPLVAQFLIGGTLLTGLGLLPFFGMDAVYILVLAVIIVAAYPAPGSLLSFTREGPLNLPLLALAVLATPWLLLNAWTNIRLQITDGSEHAAFVHWAGSSIVAVIILIASYLTATRRAGWQTLGILLGLAYLYLGAAALNIPNHDGSWGRNGGIVALITGVAYIGETIVTMRRRDVRA